MLTHWKSFASRNRRTIVARGTITSAPSRRCGAQKLTRTTRPCNSANRTGDGASRSGCASSSSRHFPTTTFCFGSRLPKSRKWKTRYRPPITRRTTTQLIHHARLGRAFLGGDAGAGDGTSIGGEVGIGAEVGVGGEAEVGSGVGDASSVMLVERRAIQGNTVPDVPLVVPPSFSMIERGRACPAVHHMVGSRHYHWSG